MRLLTRLCCITLLSLCGATALQAQPTEPTSTTILTAVPRVVRVNSTFHPADGRSPAEVESATLGIYAQETGGAPLWQETQNVGVDSEGHYSILLGATRNEGLPQELFNSAEPRWLGIQFQRPGESEQRRVLLASVPYALKASDADTLGGLPASAYLRTPTAAGATAGTASGTALSAGAPATKSAADQLAPSGTINNIAKFVTATTVGNSVMFENAGKIGLGNVNPLDFLHVTYNDASGLTGFAVQNLGSGAASWSGMRLYEQTGALGAFQAFNNHSHEYRISNAATNGVLNFVIGGASKLLVANNGNVGIGTQTPGSKLDVNGDINMAGSVRKGGALFLQNLGTNNTGVGIGALSVNTGSSNTAIGLQALTSNTNGALNTANGTVALALNKSGSQNTAIGVNALLTNSAGSNNTAAGFGALQNSTGSSNTAVGFNAGLNPTTGNNNIMIGNAGVSTDDHIIRIGDVQTKTFIVGIQGTTVGNNAATVVIDSTGQLGTAPNPPFLPFNGSAPTTASPTFAVTNSDLSGGGQPAIAGIGGSSSNSGSGGPGVLGVGGRGSFFSLPGQGVVGNGGGGPSVNGGPGVIGNGGNIGELGNGGDGVVGNGGSGDGGNGFNGGNGIVGTGGTGATAGFAGLFHGDVSVLGTLSKTAGSFKIDHPLDPANKFLSHSFVESPDMMNVYNGIAVLNDSGEVWVALPEWFEALNSDYRYQLTPVGHSAPNLYIGAEISDHRFLISGGNPGLKVSWQVTGIRRDPYAEAHRIPVEEEKSVRERGLYLHPELFGQPQERSLFWSERPELLKRQSQRDAGNAKVH